LESDFTFVDHEMVADPEVVETLIEPMVIDPGYGLKDLTGEVYTVEPSTT